MQKIPTILVSLALLAGPATAGIYYEATTETEGQTSQDMAIRSWVDGDRAKIVFGESDNPMAPEGSYLVTTDGGQTIYLVDPDEGTYTEWDLSALATGLGAMMEGMGGMLDFKFTNQKVEKLLEEGGESMLGHGTTHYRYRTSYTMQVKVFGFTQRSSTEVVTDTWATRELGGAGFRVWQQGGAPKTGMKELDEFISGQTTPVEGVVLKSVSRTETTDAQGKKSTGTTTFRVTTIREESTPDHLFVVPEEYRRTEMTLPQGEPPVLFDPKR